MNDAIVSKLEQRLGRLHARQRLGIETDHEAQKFGQGITFFHIENWYSTHWLIRNTLKLSGLYWRGQRNAERVQVRHNHICFRKLPSGFDGFTVLHLSDLHVDISEGAMRSVAELLPDLAYDVCVMTGDYRGATFGPFEPALEDMNRLRPLLRKPIYAVLGNHDTIRMVPCLEEMGIRMLLNECEPISRNSDTIYSTTSKRPPRTFRTTDFLYSFRILRRSIATPRMLGSTYCCVGTPTAVKSVCLGSIPIKLSSVLPRHMGSGAWKYDEMIGYTSVGAGTSIVPVRINCLPEITLHHFQSC